MHDRTTRVYEVQVHPPADHEFDDEDVVTTIDWLHAVRVVSAKLRRGQLVVWFETPASIDRVEGCHLVAGLAHQAVRSRLGDKKLDVDCSAKGLIGFDEVTYT